ncbi:MAG: SpoIIE family protein phosphatase [Planctomycetota bacterium]|jgi:sigma-B regulation protein RsbU (phosphoserine phosphatase)
MSPQQEAEPHFPEGMGEFPIIVLLVDDQEIIGEAVRKMLQGEADVTLHYCQDPTKALEVANRTRPTVILQDLVMPEMDGLTLVKFFRANPATRETPMIVLSSREEPVVKAEAFAIGANDYLVKLPDRLELVARIRYHSRGYINLLQRNEAYASIERSRKHMAEQIEAAAKYVKKLLPAPLEGPVTTDWRYIPSADLGGDTFGYHWIDDDHFVFYLIDVSGHGLDSALLSVTVMNVLRSRALPNTDFCEPGQVLGALNEAFPMEEYGDKFFTMWYGVFNRTDSTLCWSGGGHPPALLFEGGDDSPAEPVKLTAEAPMIGAMPWPEFEAGRRKIPAGSRLYIYSDGVHEIHKTDGGEWTFEEFVAFMSQARDPAASIIDRLLGHVRRLNGSDNLDDDFSMMEARFG